MHFKVDLAIMQNSLSACKSTESVKVCVCVSVSSICVYRKVFRVRLCSSPVDPTTTCFPVCVYARMSFLCICANRHLLTPDGRVSLLGFPSGRASRGPGLSPCSSGTWASSPSALNPQLHSPDGGTHLTGA